MSKKANKSTSISNRKRVGRPPGQRTRLKRLQQKAANLLSEQNNEDTPPADIGELIELVYEMSVEINKLMPQKRKTKK